MMSMLPNQDLPDELGMLIREQKVREQKAATDPEKDISVSLVRSGSAPPTVEGSLYSMGGLFNGSAIAGHGKFLSEEEVRADPAYVDYYYSNGNLNPRLPPPLLSREDWRLAQRNRSLFAVQPGFDGGKVVNGCGGGGDWGGDGLIGLGNGQKSFAEMIQDDMNQTTAGTRRASDAGKLRTPNNGSSSSFSYASALGSSLSRNTTPDPDTAKGVSASLAESSGLSTTFSQLNLSKNDTLNEERHLLSQSQREILDHHKPFNLQGKTNGVARKMSPLMDEEHIEFNKSAFSTIISCPRADNLHSSLSSYAFDDFDMNPSVAPMIWSKLGNGNLLPLYENGASGGSLALGSGLVGAETQVQYLSRFRNHAGRNSFVDPSLKYLRSNGLVPSQVAAPGKTALERDYLGNSYMDVLQRAYLDASISQQNLQYRNYNGNQGFGFGMPYSRSTSLSSRSRNLSAGGSLDGSFGLSLLDEFKSKTNIFEFSEIVGHVVEFSGDQYGSRFIQQKLETATIEEINMVFNEIMPQAHSLMTDVFGNFVVQKFLERGTPSQIRQLADKLIGNVLALSLQMYGCRVIQKAIEVVELDQKTEMVKELDGHVMRCIRDQNGNHVIQKCIESVPEDSIQFIFSTFYDQVVTLSTHPYGCRIIQRVLEHCHNEKTQHIMMDEIMRSVCKLAQDQYGNYVVQHVLEHGKPHERSAIIEKLAGQMVQMSQQKFASNVIEKCLTFGAPSQRKILVNEMLGLTDENEPLQAMMKDQFGNYVVQKVLETCDDQQLELVLNRIKVHLNALQKYTYGKHIVARVEKLVVAGERRISALALNPS